MVTSASCRRGRSPSTVLPHPSYFTLVPGVHRAPTPGSASAGRSPEPPSPVVICTHTHFAPFLESVGAVFPLLVCLIVSHANISLFFLDVLHATSLGVGLCPPGSHTPAQTLSHTASGQPDVLPISRAFPISKALCRKYRNWEGIVGGTTASCPRTLRFREGK